MLKDQNLEHQHHIAGFTTGLAFAGWLAEHRQGLAEGFPVDELVQFNQRITLIEPGIAFIPACLSRQASRSDGILH